MGDLVCATSKCRHVQNANKGNNPSQYQCSAAEESKYPNVPRSCENKETPFPLKEKEKKKKNTT
jgi:hypothetical protein